MAKGRFGGHDRVRDDTASETPASQPSSTAETPASETSPSTNEIFDALTAVQRRYVLHYLAGTEVVTLGELAEWVARQDEVDEDAERTAIMLHHGHLPMLTDVGLVEYDPATRTVEARPELTATAPYLPLDETR